MTLHPDDLQDQSDSDFAAIEPSPARPADADRVDRVERWFTGPVVIAAAASIPAMFLTTLDGPAEQVGSAINLATLVVFVAETLVLMVLTRDRWEWVRRHRFMVAVTLLSIPAVIFAVGPVQILRLVRMVRVIGALRILRVRRIVKAGRILRVRAGLTGWAWVLTFLVLSLAAAGFVAFVLADPTSTSRQAIDAALGRFGIIVTLGAGAILGGATYIVARSRRGEASTEGRPPTEGDGDASTTEALTPGSSR